LEGKFEGKKARGRTRRTRIVNLLQGTQKNKYHEFKTDRRHGDMGKRDMPTFLITHESFYAASFFKYADRNKTKYLAKICGIRPRKTHKEC